MKPKKDMKVWLKQHWNNLYHSTKCKMSRGAAHIARFIPWSRNDNWRRQDRKMKKPPKND